MAVDPLTAALDLGNTLINKIWPDPAQQAAEARKLMELHQKGDLAELQAQVQLLVGQLKINEQEAAHPSKFVAGWRPFIGWTGGLSLLYAGLLEPFLRFAAQVWFSYDGDFPTIDTTMTIQIVMGMLGLGAMRSFDKSKKTDTKETK